MDKKIVDYIIIGGGISGLYSAYLIKKLNKKSTFLILEKNNKEGGRLGNYQFYGEKVVTGAGIGRKEKDKILLNLVKELNIPTKEFKIDYDYSKKIIKKVDIVKIINYLKEKYNGEKEIFKKFALKILGEKSYKDFVINTGYSDYENSDIINVLYNYGMEDNKCCSVGVSIPWEELIKKLTLSVGIKNIKDKEEVIKIEKNEKDFKIITNSKNIYFSYNIILATTIDTIKKLLPTYKLYNNIIPQKFIRIYGKFNKKSSLIMKEYVNKTTIVPTILQKIIPINQEKGIYMIAYSDNKNAIKLKKIEENSEINRKKLCEIIEISLGIKKKTLKLIAIKSFFWNTGTHYYKPLDIKIQDRKKFIEKIQHPKKNILVVGEAVAIHQGWTEGALESIINSLPNFIQEYSTDNK